MIPNLVNKTDRRSINSFLDMGHMTLSPSTNPFKLYKLAYCTPSEKKILKEFREQFSVEIEFSPGDENKYPLILKQNVKTKILLPKNSIDSHQKTNQLIRAIEDRIVG